jgi:hypothetical protein
MPGPAAVAVAVVTLQLWAVDQVVLLHLAVAVAAGLAEHATPQLRRAQVAQAVLVPTVTPM